MSDSHYTYGSCHHKRKVHFLVFLTDDNTSLVTHRLKTRADSIWKEVSDCISRLVDINCVFLIICQGERFVPFVFWYSFFFGGGEGERLVPPCGSSNLSLYIYNLPIYITICSSVFRHAFRCLKNLKKELYIIVCPVMETIEKWLRWCTIELYMR